MTLLCHYTIVFLLANHFTTLTNMPYNPWNRPSPERLEKLNAIKLAYGIGLASLRELARRYGIPESTVLRHKNENKWPDPPEKAQGFNRPAKMLTGSSVIKSVDNVRKESTPMPVVTESVQSQPIQLDPVVNVQDLIKERSNEFQDAISGILTQTAKKLAPMEDNCYEGLSKKASIAESLARSSKIVFGLGGDKPTVQAVINLGVMGLKESHED
jgi:hypothetical protein